MANIMDLIKTRIKTTREGYDLSKKVAFTGKVGELLPCYCKEVMSGDVFNIDFESFTRTIQVNTAAYTRMRQYYDFYFVPTRLLWNRFNTFYTSMGSNNMNADSITSSTKLSDEHPYFTTQQITNYLSKIEGQTNYFGYERGYGTRKILDLLGYGDFFAVDEEFPSRVNAALNPFPLLAYQKVYQDFFRNSQWEDAFAPAYNLNYITGDGDLNIPISELGSQGEIENMFDMRYCNWNKDYFMGLLPNSQFGDVASVDIGNIDLSYVTTPVATAGSNTTGYIFDARVKDNTDDSFASGPVYHGGSDMGESTPLLLQNGSQPAKLVLTQQQVSDLRSALGIGAGSTNVVTSINASSLKSTFTILALRLQEAKQRWSEVVQSNNQDVQAQFSAQFGVHVSDAYSDRCQYIGGSVASVDINEAENTNLIGDNAVNIKGKGVGVQRGNRLKFSTDIPGYIIGIYHCVPLLDYAITGVARQNLKTKLMDYAQPAFDKTGMVSVSLIELTNTKVRDVGYDENPLLGYAPRYIDYKTDIDTVHGGFKHGGLDAWVAPVSDDYISAYLDALGANAQIHTLTYPFFKVNPAFVNPIFIANADSTLETDQLLINCAFNIKAVRSLDRNGLPF